MTRQVVQLICTFCTITRTLHNFPFEAKVEGSDLEKPATNPTKDT